MKNLYLYITLLAVTVMSLFSGCNSSFLEEDPNRYISSDQLQENARWNPNILLGQALGIYQTTIITRTGGTTGQNDFGQKSVDIATDLMSGDLALSGEMYGWFADDAKLVNTSRTHDRAYMIWRYYYRIIKACNEIFDTVGGDENLPEDETNQIYYAQAKVMRAHSYFNLVNLYAKQYDVAKNEKAIPVYRSQLTSETKGLSTVDEVYTLILSDMTEAVKILEDSNFKRPGDTRDQVDQWVAKGILAYVYLTMGDNENAAEVSKNVIENSPFRLMTSEEIINTGFRTYNLPSFMWAFDITMDNRGGLAGFWGQLDYFTYSYTFAGDRMMLDDNVYYDIPGSDTRKKWFLADTPTAKQPRISWYKFYSAARVAGSDRNWINDVVFMRLEEMYLINAEANARRGRLDLALQYYADFMQERDAATAATLATLGPDDLLENIYFNWRLEMWAEGRGLMTMKRFKKTVTRAANNFSQPGVAISYDDPRMIFNIPEREITNNPNLN